MTLWDSRIFFAPPPLRGRSATPWRCREGGMLPPGRCRHRMLRHRMLRMSLLGAPRDPPPPPPPPEGGGGGGGGGGVPHAKNPPPPPLRPGRLRPRPVA